MNIRTDDRVFVCGKTGCGKTFFVKNTLLLGYPRVVFWDIKRQNADWPHSILVRNPDALKAALLLPQNSRILYQPTDIGQGDFDEVCGHVYAHGNIAIYIDEVAFITGGNQIERNHKLLLIMGRSRGIGVVTGTQRPKDISNFCISEAEHFFIGRLQLEDDVKKISRLLPKKHRELQRIPKYSFLYTDSENVCVVGGEKK